jgi:transposase
MKENEMYYAGLDIHKKIIAHCVKKSDGTVVAEGKIPARRADLIEWANSIDHPWIGAMEATMFTGWIYDTLKPYAEEVKVANPQMLKAITCSKKKSDRIDANKICDLTRVDLLPECYMAPQWMRELRRVLRFRNFLVHHCSSLKNKTASILMELGIEYTKSKLHGKRYFHELLGTLTDAPTNVIPLMQFNHETMRLFESTQRHLIHELKKNERLAARVARLQSIPGVGDVLSLTWALEIGEPERFSSIRRAVSYCGLCGRFISSAGIKKRAPISKQRNKHLQWALIEVAKLAPRHNVQLASEHEKSIAKGANKNQATLAVARKLVAYLMAVDKSGKPFVTRDVGKPLDATAS